MLARTGLETVEVMLKLLISSVQPLKTLQFARESPVSLTQVNLTLCAG